MSTIENLKSFGKHPLFSACLTCHIVAYDLARRYSEIVELLSNSAKMWQLPASCYNLLLENED